jgi:predicted transcriptional regulator
MSTSVSTNLDDAVAARAREIAQREHRSLSNLVANAVTVFTDLPKELRDILLELRGANDETGLRTLNHEIRALVARARFETATQRLVSEGKFPSLPDKVSELELMEAATALTLREIRHRD